MDEPEGPHMNTSKCPECAAPFVDEHGHGLCFGCKVKGITFGSVRQGPSIWALEKKAVEDARASGIEPERYEGQNASKNLAERKAKTDKELKKVFDGMREKVQSG